MLSFIIMARVGDGLMVRTVIREAAVLTSAPKLEPFHIAFLRFRRGGDESKCSLLPSPSHSFSNRNSDDRNAVPGTETDGTVKLSADRFANAIHKTTDQNLCLPPIMRMATTRPVLFRIVRLIVCNGKIQYFSLEAPVFFDV